MTPAADPATPAAFGFSQRFDTLATDWRTFPQHYLLYATSGAFHLELAEAQWVLPPQRAAWIAADVPIRIRIAAPVTCASVLFAKASLAPFGFACRVFAVSALAREMIQYAMRWGPDRAQHDRTADQFFGSLAAVCMELAESPDQYWLPRVRSRELTLAVEYMGARLAEPISMSEAARHAGVSERTLARRFTEETALSWRQYLLRARMILAMEQLSAADRSVSEVAHDSGFSSMSAFINAFRRFTGAAPLAYRRAVRR